MGTHGWTSNAPLIGSKWLTDDKHDKLGRQTPKLWKELYDQFRALGDSKSVAKRKAHQIAAKEKDGSTDK